MNFLKKDVPKKVLLEEIRQKQTMLQKTLLAFPDDKMRENYPLEVFGSPMTHEYFLTHLSYHLDQVNYHRRLLDI